MTNRAVSPLRAACMMMIMLVVLTLTTTACGGSKGRILKTDPLFSVNLIVPPADWPNEKKDWPKKDPRQAAFMQKVYEEHGKPDYFRVLYDRSGRVMTLNELNAKAWATRNRRQSKVQPNVEWIYLDDKITFEFRPSGPVKKELPDNIRTLTEYGDPQDIKNSTDINKNPVLIYQYYDRGKVFYYNDGKLTKEENQTPLPGMTIRR